MLLQLPHTICKPHVDDYCLNEKVFVQNVFFHLEPRSICEMLKVRVSIFNVVNSIPGIYIISQFVFIKRTIFIYCAVSFIVTEN